MPCILLIKTDSSNPYHLNPIYKSKHFPKTIITCYVVFCSLLSHPVFAFKISEKSLPWIEKKPLNRNSNKINQNLNNKSVRIYPDILKRTIHVVAKERKTKEIDFIVFDMKGTLMLNQKMKTGSHERISGLARGLYSYHVFDGYIESTSGLFEIK